MTTKVYSPANYIKHWAQRKPDACFLRQPINNKWQETSWSEAYDKVAKLATYLKKYPKDTKIGLYANNCSDWFLVDMAILAAGMISVPIYPSASDKTISQILNHSETQLVFVGNLADYSHVATIEKNADVIAIHSKQDGYPFWLELIDELEPLRDFFQPNKKDIATIVYTSGTTGMPKGVVMSYRAISGGLECIENTIEVDGDDTFLSYLPLAHILERIAVEILSIVYGCQVSFVENLSTFSKNLVNTEPTIFIAVPRIWVKIKQGIEKKFGGAKRFKKLTNLPLIGGFIARRVIKKLGLANTKYNLTGAAAISVDTIEWYDQLGLPLMEGYGLSETLGLSNLNIPKHRRVGTVGKVMNGCELLVAENGEILLRSPCLMDGYYKESELTAAAIQDGWFRTGDLGQVDESGYLSIKGRVKEIFKTSKGKYISPVPIEQSLENIFSVEQTCVFGSQLSQPIAVIVCSDYENKKADESFVADCKEKLEQLNATLEKHEQLDALLVSSNEWTTKNEMMTPTLKIRRQQVEDHYQSLFLNNEAVLNNKPKDKYPVLFVD